MTFCLLSVLSNKVYYTTRQIRAHSLRLDQDFADLLRFYIMGRIDNLAPTELLFELWVDCPLAELFIDALVNPAATLARGKLPLKLSVVPPRDLAVVWNEPINNITEAYKKIIDVSNEWLQK